MPSPLVWDVYLKFIQKNQATEKNISEIRFRDKSYGWSNYSMSITFEDGSKYIRSSKEDAFLRAFGSGISLRPSCYNCQFKYPNWQADITLGDFWNVETLEPNISNKSGTSVVFVLNEKGCNLLNIAKKNLTLYLTTIDKVIEGQHGIVENLRPNKNRENFFSEININKVEEFQNLVNRFTKITIRAKIKMFLSMFYRTYIKTTFKRRQTKNG